MVRYETETGAETVKKTFLLNYFKIVTRENIVIPNMS